jgi:hypothetical protein
MKVATLFLAVLFLAGCGSQFGQTEMVDLTRPAPGTTVPTPVPTPAPTPTPTDAHGCSDDDWLNADRYRDSSERLAQLEENRREIDEFDRTEWQKAKKKLDDRQDLDAKIERHSLGSTPPQMSPDDFELAERGYAAADLAAISPRCRAWLTNGGGR